MYQAKLRFRGGTRIVDGVTAWRDEAGTLVLVTAAGEQRHTLAHFADQTRGGLASWVVSAMVGEEWKPIAVGG